MKVRIGYDPLKVEIRYRVGWASGNRVSGRHMLANVYTGCFLSLLLACIPLISIYFCYSPLANAIRLPMIHFRRIVWGQEKNDTFLIHLKHSD